MRACMRFCLRVCVHACKHACVCACDHASMRACMHTCMCACRQACIHASLRTCVHMCVCALRCARWVRQGAIDLAKALEHQRELTSLPASFLQPCVVLDLDLSMNPIEDDGAEAFAKAATRCLVDPAAAAFKAPWGLERLNLSDTIVGRRGISHLESAVAARAGLATAAVDRLSHCKAEDVLEALRSRRIHQPSGLTVLGLEIDDTLAASLLGAAKDPRPLLMGECDA